MITIIVESTDRELINDIWSLQTDGVTLEEQMLKCIGSTGEITVYVNLAAASLAFVSTLLNLIVNHNNKKPSHTKTIIKSTEKIEDMKGVASRYEKITHIEIHEEH